MEKRQISWPIFKHLPIHMHLLTFLREKYETVLNQEGVVGLSIATRPDCLPDDVVEYLAELHERTYLWVELGLQTVHEQTAQLINRAHDFPLYIEGVEKAS